MVSEDRQRIIETNRSLRLIKNELESLLEKGIITDAAFDSISDLLPAETPLSGAAAARTTTTTHNNLPTPARSTASPAPSSHSQTQPPSQVHPNPPSYAHSQSTAAPPSLPSRNNPAPPAQPPSRPVLARARALYRYAAGDARDVSFERDDELAVLEYMNADWWMGRNERTGGEGIFPRSYVVVLPGQEQGEKAGGGGYPAQPVYAGQQPGPQGGGYPVSPVPVGGYPAPPPPGQAAVPYQQGGQQVDQGQGQGGDSKFGEQGKKFGKKLGNAAIFGAGATIGSNIVNSIF